MNMDYPTNKEIADVLERVADLLEAQDANRFRIRAYRRASQMVEHFHKSISEIVANEEQNKKKLERLPCIGKSIASSIREFVHTRRLLMLDRLEGLVSSEELFATVPGIGDVLARRIHLKLHIDTLEDLELAAYDGRLETIPGLGKRRIKGLIGSLSTILVSSNRRFAKRRRFLEEGNKTESPPHPHISVILKVDREYRYKANTGELKTITPRRFNPENKSWLPILHTERKGWYFTAMFSNTARAHELGKTDDWVIVYYERDGNEDQCTVVTEQHGALKGLRVVRGHESECLRYYGIIL